MFTKQNDKLAFKKDADLHAGGLIVQGKQITGTFQKCTVKSWHDDGSNKKVVASCSDGVSFSDMAFSPETLWRECDHTEPKGTGAGGNAVRSLLPVNVLIA